MKQFRIPLLIFALVIIGVFFVGGIEQALAVAVLAVLEISLSFDNAVINATILRRMNAFWQMIFLTVGMLIAVVGMRLLLPILIVVATGSLSFGSVIDLALHNPALYAQKLDAAHPAIAAFGGIFLIMIFLDFVLDETKRVHWLELLERPLARAGRLKTLSTLIALVALLLVASSTEGSEKLRVLEAGIIGLVSYLSVRGLGRLFEGQGGVSQAGPSTGQTVKLAGRAAFFMFIYLEVIDASFSFDGVIGAFAISTNVLTIALGLGLGALFIRELTVWLVRNDTLAKFIYLEHGAHYAIGALAVLLAVGLQYHVPELLTGSVGAALIVLALGSSVMHNRSHKKA